MSFKNVCLLKTKRMINNDIKKDISKVFVDLKSNFSLFPRWFHNFS